jgi:anti-sigma factor RsiW
MTRVTELHPDTGRCEDVAELLAVWADEGLDGEQDRRVTAHVRACPACAAQVEADRKLLNGLREAAPVVPEQDERFWDDLATSLEAQAAVVVPMARRPSRRAPVFAGLAVAAAAVLALFALRAPIEPSMPRPQPAAQPVMVADAGATRAEDPPVQVAQPTEDPTELIEELGVEEIDPLEAIDELGDDELEALSRVLGEGA